MPEPERLRRSPDTRAAALEGAPADAFLTLATGSALTGWAITLGGSPLYLAALQSLLVGSQILHPLGAWLTQRAPRKRLATTSVLVSRLVWAPMALVALLDVSEQERLWALFAVTAISAAANVLYQNALGAWLGDVVPAGRRGRFFAERSRAGVAAASSGSLLLAVLLDPGESPSLWALAALAIAIALLGLASALLLRRIEAPAARRERATLAEAWADPRLMPLLGYQLAFSFAVSPGVAFFALWVLQRNEGTYLMMAGHAALLATTRILVAPFWGRMVDRSGARTVLAICTVGTAIMPVLWLVMRPGFLWPLALDAIASGAMWGGQAIAMFDLPLRASTERTRPQALALSAGAAGLGWVLGSLFFGRLAELVPTVSSIEPMYVVFALCALGRAGSGLLALRVIDGRAEEPSPALRADTSRA
jgi:MFS family permease